MARFFMAGGTFGKGGTVLLTGADAEHAKVLRLKVGERIVVCDGKGSDRHCTVTRITKDGIEAEVGETERSPGEPDIAVTVLAGLPKMGERADYVVQKCTESGAVRIVFFLCHRCVARPTRSGLEKKRERWRRIAEEAAKQSGRGIIPEVGVLPDFPAALDIAIKTDLPLFLYETGKRTPLKTAIEAAGAFQTAAVITGPEGGFEPFEAELAAKLGFQVCSMGPRILRCETAPTAALTALMYATENL